jgi:hypothetical protein
MDKETKEIISKIASIQKEAIHRIIEKPEEHDNNLLVELLQIDLEEIVVAAEQLYNFYNELETMPWLINLANEYQLLVCSHILFRMEDEWILDNSQGVYGAWGIIHQALSKFHPEFKLII